MTCLIVMAIALIAGIMIGVGIGAKLVQQGYGVGFNMTEEQRQEWNLVPVCSATNKSQIFIEGLSEQCSQIYGGPVT